MQENTLILNRYRVLEQLGSGGFATVYRAFDERIARRVAIKVLPLRAAAGKAGTLAGLEEARTAAMLSHPSIVSLFDFEIDQDRKLAYLIMEDTGGITLADIGSEHLTDEIIAAVTKAVSDALVYAHKNGVLHLDVKPTNILINHEGQIKLADFGLAQLSRNAHGKHGRAIAGTVGYMPLEQLAADEVSEASDQWALAAVLYELLANEYPYHEQLPRKATAEAMLRAQQKDEVALLDLGDIVLEGIFARALARNPEARFDSVKDFADVLLFELGERPAATAGKRELRALVPELASDDPADHERDRLRRRGRRRTDDSEQERIDLAGCLALGLNIGLKIIAAVALAICLLAWVAPGILQLRGNNQWLVVQVAAGVFIISATIGLLSAARRRRSR
ncbi:MAG: serine/threonine protein kinase [Coriobacteriia bacterium]|nr:serine/threonine protein kinase [Coriobacteriia bacterium]